MVILEHALTAKARVMERKYWASLGVRGRVLKGPGTGSLGFWLSYEASWFLRKRLVPLFYGTNTWHWVSLKVSSHQRPRLNPTDPGMGTGEGGNQHRELYLFLVHCSFPSRSGGGGEKRGLYQLRPEPENTFKSEVSSTCAVKTEHANP